MRNLKAHQNQLEKREGSVMKILYVGNYKQRHCTEVHLAATLEDLGHQVKRIQEDEVSQQELAKLLSNEQFDLFLYTRTWGKTVTMEHLAQLRERKIPSASYHLDLYIGLKREEGLDSDPFWRTDYVFTPDGDPASAEVFKAKGINHHYMKPGVYKPECYLGTPQEQFKHDVIFVGTGGTPEHPRQYGHPEWKYRGELIQWLKDTYGDRFGKYGDPDPTIRNKQLNDLYASAKVVVGDSLCLNFKKPHYWSDRAYETLGRGGFLIHPFIQGMDEEFTHGKHLAFYSYGNFMQLKQLIDHFIMDDEHREFIRKAGHEFVKNNATYHDRLKQMLKIVFPKFTGNISERDRNGEAPAIKINLGSGNDPLKNHVNLDMLKRDDVDVVHNLMDFPYPFASNIATHIKAIDVIEHLDNYTAEHRPTIMAFIEECHRILKPGGELYIQTPSWDSELFKIDPTHVRGFHRNSFDFFDPDTEYGKIRDFYSTAKFKVRVEELENKNLRFWMVKR